MENKSAFQSKSRKVQEERSAYVHRASNQQCRLYIYVSVRLVEYGTRQITAPDSPEMVCQFDRPIN